MKRFDRIFVVFLLGFFSSLAPSAKAQGTFTAATCNQADVNALINGPAHKAVNGDTINIPAGSCTWTSGISVPQGIGISIVGAGQGVTIIKDQLSSGSLISMSPIFGNSTSRISSMTLLPSLPRTGYGQPIWITGTCTPSGCPNLRIDHITAPSSWAGIGISDDTFAVVNNMFGVADHNLVGDVPPNSNGVVLINVGHGAWKGVPGWGDNSWASPDTFGTNQAFYIENNTFNYAVGTDVDTYSAGGGGGRFVCRFNKFNNISNDSNCTNHGTDTGGRLRSGRQLEFYGNTASCASSCNSMVGDRGGVSIVFGNLLTSGHVNNVHKVDAQRRWRPDSPWGGCDGTQPWDTDDGTIYYSGTIGSVSSGSGSNYIITDGSNPGGFAPGGGKAYSFRDVTKGFGYEINASSAGSFTVFASGYFGTTNVPAGGDRYQILRATACMDQPARGAGALITGNDGYVPAINGFLSPVLSATGNPGPVNQVLDPIYEFADSTSGGATMNGGVAAGTALIIANRDYYQESVNQAAQTSQTSPFNGTSGTGHGTLANRPATCTTGVGYFATDQGNWNTSGINFPGQSFSQGQLFVCAAPNTWALHYTPYTYPHPLITGGTTTGGTSPNPPSSLQANVQ
jgi:hypothetical protein